MRITFVVPTPNLAGGIRVLAIYAERLKKRGHEVLVVSVPKPQPTLRQQIRSLLRGQGWISAPSKEASHFDNTGVPLKIIESYRPITDNDVPDADVIVASWWEMAEWVANLSKAKGAKVYFLQGHAGEFDHLPKERVKATYSLPMHKITISKWLVDLHKTQYGNTDIAFVPNSVDTKQFNAPPRSKQTTPTIGMLYSTLPLKGCDVSLKAFSIVAQKFPELRLVAFGAQEPTQDLPLPINTDYIRQPSQDVIKNIYAKCDAWLFSSNALEGFGLPILEAMACRTPVISTPSGAAPELLANGGGILVQNIEEMTKAIEKICHFSPKQWQTMSDIAFATATQYTWDNATELFEQALLTAIK